MPIPLMLAGVLKGLAANGLGILANAVLAKGKDVVEKQLGVEIPSSVEALTPEKVAELKQLEFQHEEFLINAALKEKELELEAEKHGATQVTERWKSDMASDSWLSKNIRPLTLIFILGVYTLFALLSSTEFAVDDAYVTLLGQWGMLIMSAYFVGRTVEKGVSVVSGRKQK